MTKEFRRWVHIDFSRVAIDEYDCLGYAGVAYLYPDRSGVNFTWSPEFGVTSLEQHKLMNAPEDMEFINERCTLLYNKR